MKDKLIRYRLTADYFDYDMGEIVVIYQNRPLNKTECWAYKYTEGMRHPHSLFDERIDGIPYDIMKEIVITNTVGGKLV